MKQRDTVISMCLYAILGLGTQILVEIWPLWVLLPTIQGGLVETCTTSVALVEFGSSSSLALQASDIGALMMLSAPFQLFTQIVIYPRACKRWGLASTFRRASLWVATVRGLIGRNCSTLLCVWFW